VIHGVHYVGLTKCDDRNLPHREEILGTQSILAMAEVAVVWAVA